MERAYTPDFTTHTANRKDRRWKRSTLFACAVGIIAFFFYEYLLYYYYYGDPYHYQRYYDSLVNSDIVYALISQRDYLGSSEVIYPLVAWAGSNAGFDRNFLMAVFDGIMYSALITGLLRRKCSILFVLLSIANFYLLVLATSAERLKFSYICLFMVLSATSRLKVIWLILAPLAHFQSLLTEGAILIWHFIAALSQRVKIILAISAAVVSGLIIYFFSSALILKFSSYRGHGGILESLSGIALFGISFLIFKGKFRAFLALTPLIFLTFLLGSDRMNMVTFSVFAYLCIQEGKTKNPVVLAIMAYFAFKSIAFVKNILLYGDGFFTP